MRPKDLYVVLRPSESVDSRGNDLPWQNYIHITNERGYCSSSNVNDAFLFMNREEAERCLQQVSSKYRIATLDEAIRYAMDKASDIREWEIVNSNQ